MQNISDLRKIVDSTLTLHSNSLNELKIHSDRLSEIKENLDDHKKVREIFQQASIFTQSYMEKHLSSIVTNSIRSVFFEKNIEFKLEFDKKRNSTECNLTLIEDGEEYDIMDDRGFGMVDIISFSLRVAYVLLDKVDKVIILDEPFRNLDKDRTQYASEMVKELSRSLGIQFIIVTHIDALSEHADKVFHVSKKGKFSEVN